MEVRMKKNKKKIIISVIVLVLIFVCVCLLIFSNSVEDETQSVVLKDSIESYSYTLDERDTELFENEYEILKEILLADEIDYDLYAEQISKLFVIDFYTLNNKISKYDVGGLEYLNEDIKENFRLKAEDYIYKYVGTMSEFPEVSSIFVDEINEEQIAFYDENYSGYTLALSWEYIEDYGYDTSGTIEIILNNEKLEIVEFIGVS